MIALQVTFFILLLLALCLGLFNKTSYQKTQSKRVFCFFSFIILLSLRTFVDIESLPDLLGYKFGFTEIANLGWSAVPFGDIGVKSPEVLFRLLNKLVAIVWNDFTFFLFVFGIIWLGLYYKAVCQLSPYIAVSILILYLSIFNQSLFVVRQHMAMAVFFYSLKYIIDKDLKKTILCVIVAFGFHQTAIIVFPLYFIYNNLKSTKQLVFTLTITGIIVSYSILYFLNNAAVFLVGYESYVKHEEVANSTGAIISGMILSLYVITLRGAVFRDGINKLLLIMMSIGFILSFAGIGFNPTARLAMYYTSCAFLCVPIILEHISNSFIRFALVFFVLTFYYYFAYYSSSALSIQNYSF